MSLHPHCIGWTDLPANTTLDALYRIQCVGTLFLTAYCTAGTIGKTLTAADAGIRINRQLEQPFTGTSRTPFVINMLFILLPEVADGGQDRIGSSSPQSTQGGIDDCFTHVFKELDVSFPAVAFGDVGKDFQHPSGAFTAGGTLPA